MGAQSLLVGCRFGYVEIICPAVLASFPLIEVYLEC